MKFSITAALAAAFALLCAQAVWAQDSSMPEGSKKEHSITGCLRSGKTANSYMISNRMVGAPRAAGIVSSAPNLAPHLGQKVEIRGLMVPAKEAEADPNVPRAAHYMQVMAIKKIADSCP